MAPKFNGKLNKHSEFISSGGSKLAASRLGLDGFENRKVNKLHRYYTNTTSHVPMEILNTGNVEVLTNYLAENSLSKGSPDREHLEERISVMKYFNELEEYNNCEKTRPVPVGPMKDNGKGQKVLPGLVLDRNQTSGNGCWSCVMSLLLKGRGVDVSQELIRRYRPEYLEGLGPSSPEQTDMMNGDVISEIFQYSELVGKLSPNTMVKLYGGDDYSPAKAKKHIIDSLRNRNTPVARCSGNHWTTIVGISEDNSTVYYADSLYGAPGQLMEAKLDDLVKTSGNYVWTESIELNEFRNRYKNLTVDPSSGAVVMNSADQFYSTPATQTKDIFMREDDDTEVYIPGMIRDFSKDYKTQKAEYKDYKAAHKTETELKDEARSREFSANRKYTYITDYSRDKMQKDFREEILRILDDDRRNYLVNTGKYTEENAKKLSREDLRKEFADPVNAGKKAKQQNSKLQPGKIYQTKPQPAAGFSDEEIQKAIAESIETNAAEQKKREAERKKETEKEPEQPMLKKEEKPEEKNVTEKDKKKAEKEREATNVLYERHEREKQDQDIKATEKEIDALNIAAQEIGVIPKSDDLNVSYIENKNAKKGPRDVDPFLADVGKDPNESFKINPTAKVEPGIVDNFREDPKADLNVSYIENKNAKKGPRDVDPFFAGQDKDPDVSEIINTNAKKEPWDPGYFVEDPDAGQNVSYIENKNAKEGPREAKPVPFGDLDDSYMIKPDAGMDTMSPDLLFDDFGGEIGNPMIDAEDMEALNVLNDSMTEPGRQKKEQDSEIAEKKNAKEKDPGSRSASAAEKKDAEKKQDIVSDKKPQAEAKTSVYNTVLNRFKEYNDELAADDAAYQRRLEAARKAAREASEARRAAYAKKKAREADKAAHRNAYKSFAERIKASQTSPVPELRSLKMSMFEAQLDLSDTFAQYNKVNENVLDAAAKLMTYATIDKVCSIPDTDPQTIKALTDPKNIKNYINEIRSSGDFVKNAAEALCQHAGKDHILSWDSKEIRKMMVSQLSAVVTAKDPKLAKESKNQPAPKEEKKENVKQAAEAKVKPEPMPIDSKKVEDIANIIINDNGKNFVLNGKEGNVKNIVEAELKKQGNLKPSKPANSKNSKKHEDPEKKPENDQVKKKPMVHSGP